MTPRFGRAALLTAAAALLIGGAATFAWSQSQWPNPVDRSSSPLVVMGCINASSQAVPCTNQAGTSTPNSVQGDTAHDAVDTGNPVKIGCRASNNVFSAVSVADRSDVRCNLVGNEMVSYARSSAGSSDAAGQLAVYTDDLTSGTTNPQGAANYFFNGATWDRGFTCPTTAVVNVTAAATTEIVALTASQTIRVCSINVSMSAAGTATFVTGTGTNCGTGTTALTGAMPLATGIPLSVSGMLGSLMRSLVANALCVTAATGNVVGWVTYAKY